MMDRKLMVACQLASVTRTDKENGYFLWKAGDNRGNSEERDARGEIQGYR